MFENQKYDKILEWQVHAYSIDGRETAISWQDHLKEIKIV